MDRGLVEELVKEHGDPKRRARLMLESDVVIRRQGVRADRAPTRDAPAAGAAPDQRLTAADRGTTYKLARLKRDHPAVLERLARGELPSVEAAWEAAGFRVAHLKVFLDPMNIARVVVTRLSPAEQREVVDLVQHPEKITAPPHGRASAAWRAFDAARTTPEERARREAEREAKRVAARAELDARRREDYAAAREAQRAQAAALGLPSLLGRAGGVDTVEAAG